MKKMIGLVAGEPNSINSEIIVKAWKKIDNKAKIFIIGNYLLIKKQMHEMNLQIPFPCHRYKSKKWLMAKNYRAH